MNRKEKLALKYSNKHEIFIAFFLLCVQSSDQLFKDYFTYYFTLFQARSQYLRLERAFTDSLDSMVYFAMSSQNLQHGMVDLFF